MKILAVDTALGACSAAVLDGESILAHQFEVKERGHAEALAPMVQVAMRQACMTFAELESLAVTTGPGTFTGQRVGLAFMRGLRVALKIPLIGVTTLEAMAFAAMNECGTAFSAALHDARRGEVYMALHGARQTIVAPLLLPLGDAVSMLDEKMRGVAHPLAFAGTAAEAACALYAETALLGRASSIRSPDAVWVARIALKKPVAHGAPPPLYLRPPDARLPTRSS